MYPGMKQGWFFKIKEIDQFLVFITLHYLPPADLTADLSLFLVLDEFTLFSLG